jgi:hypothetical protein
MPLPPRGMIKLMPRAKQNIKNPPTSTLKAEKANKGHENSIDPDLSPKDQHG